ERNWLLLADQHLETATRLSARSFEIVFTEDPQLRRFHGTKRRHWIVSKWRPGQRILKLLAHFSGRVRQNEMRIVTMHILVPRLVAVLGLYCIETVETLREIALKHSLSRGCNFQCL